MVVVLFTNPFTNYNLDQISREIERQTWPQTLTYCKSNLLLLNVVCFPTILLLIVFLTLKAVIHFVKLGELGCDEFFRGRGWMC